MTQFFDMLQKMRDQGRACKSPRDCSPPFLLERPQGPRTGDFTSALITISGRLLTACSKKGPAQFSVELSRSRWRPGHCANRQGGDPDTVLIVTSSRDPATSELMDISVEKLTP